MRSLGGKKEEVTALLKESILRSLAQQRGYIKEGKTPQENEEGFLQFLESYQGKTIQWASPSVYSEKDKWLDQYAGVKIDLSKPLQVEYAIDRKGIADAEGYGMYIEIVVEKDKQGNYRFQKVVIWVSEDDQEYWDGGKIGAQTRFLQFCASIVAGEDVTEPEEVLFGDFWQRFFPDWPEHPLDPKNKEEWTKWGDRLREDIKAGKLSLQTHFVQRSKVSPTPEPTEIPTATPTPRPTETPTPRPTETPTPQPPETAEKRIERALNSFPLPVISEAENNGYEYLPTLLRVGRPADGRRGCAASPRQCIPACGRWRPPPASGHIPLPRGRCENGRSTGEAPLRPSAGLWPGAGLVRPGCW